MTEDEEDIEIAEAWLPLANEALALELGAIDAEIHEALTLSAEDLMTMHANGRDADADIAAGRFTRHLSSEDFISDLEARTK